MSTAKCRHLSISEEAYRNGTPAPVFVCGWPVRKIGVSPAWVDRLVGGGLMVDPKSECANCPCFERQTAITT
jgi:hypothetical protein